MKPSVGVAAPLLLIAAAMLIAGVVAPSLWIAVIAVGIALAVFGARTPSNKAHGDWAAALGMCSSGTVAPAAAGTHRQCQLRSDGYRAAGGAAAWTGTSEPPARGILAPAPARARYRLPGQPWWSGGWWKPDLRPILSQRNGGSRARFGRRPRRSLDGVAFLFRRCPEGPGIGWCPRGMRQGRSPRRPAEDGHGCATLV